MDSPCCRTCLSEQNLNHIFAMPEGNDKYAEIIFTTTGIKVEISDNLPKYVCTQCMSFINECHKFRQKCRDTERTLLEKYEQKPFCKVKEEDAIPEFTTTIEVKKINDENFENDFHDADDNITLAEYNIKIEDGKTKKETESTFKKTVKEKNKDAKCEDSKEVKLRRKYTRRKDVDKKLQEPKVPKKRVRKKVAAKKPDEETENSKIMENGESKKCETNEFKCSLCPRVFTIKTALYTHKKSHMKRAVCEHCGMRFPTPHRLLRHCRSKHGYEKAHKCSYCDYMGVDAVQVRVHERLHTGEKPYVCSQCGASFARSSSLLQHVASHLPTKTVKCDQCPRLFKSKKLMLIHRTKHINKYTYGCRVCEKLFSTRCNLVKHLQRIHSLEPDANNIVRTNKMNVSEILQPTAFSAVKI